MAHYYVNRNAQDNGDHEVHVRGCAFMPDEHNRIYLGDFGNCHTAVQEARRHYDQVNGCYYCAHDCHTR